MNRRQAKKRNKKMKAEVRRLWTEAIDYISEFYNSETGHLSLPPYKKEEEIDYICVVGHDDVDRLYTLAKGDNIPFARSKLASNVFLSVLRTGRFYYYAEEEDCEWAAPSKDLLFKDEFYYIRGRIHNGHFYPYKENVMYVVGQPY